MIVRCTKTYEEQNQVDTRLSVCILSVDHPAATSGGLFGGPLSTVTTTGGLFGAPPPPQACRRLIYNDDNNRPCAWWILRASLKPADSAATSTSTSTTTPAFGGSVAPRNQKRPGHRYLSPKLQVVSLEGLVEQPR